MGPVYANLPFGACMHFWDAYGCCAGCTDHERRTQQFTEHMAEKAGPGCGFPESKERSGSSIWIVS